MELLAGYPVNGYSGRRSARLEVADFPVCRQAGFFRRHAMSRTASAPETTTIVTFGPSGSDCYLAARRYAPTAYVLLVSHRAELFAALAEEHADLALLPVYNTREGDAKEYFRLQRSEFTGFWVDNLVLPTHLSLAGLSETVASIEVIIGKASGLRQCAEYLETHFPDATLQATPDIEAAIADIKAAHRHNYAVIEEENLLLRHGLHLLERELAAHNRTRYAILGRELAPESGYDATALVTRPMADRLGLLSDIIGEFTRRGVNILDLQTHSDAQSQKLRVFLEVEGHIAAPALAEAVARLENVIIHENEPLRLLGSFPRVDMREKLIKSFGFIGTGKMSAWFAERLNGEGYITRLCGRTTALRPERMIPDIDVLMICVPISVTAATIALYAPLLKSGQALIILAGEAETALRQALDSTDPGVEVMFVHNLWGPQAATMKDKNATVTRTPRSGVFCSEFEAFLFKHGAEINHDEARRHDLMMGVGQKLPTAVSIAMAATLLDNSIDCQTLGRHSTLTSQYGVLAMARVHNQNPRTYAEILASGGEGRKIVRDFATNMAAVIALAEAGDISGIERMITANSRYLGQRFLRHRMKQAKAVDALLSDGAMKGEG
ncbi:MAG: prephenate dehydrogenase/arogenate dehydrogenase family protein [Desulfobulbaceae bacterium]|nr:prephenate dehydrogenase/arogenate dehydrogenase family protein [Desulfobulbaceae bacterium]